MNVVLPIIFDVVIAIVVAAFVFFGVRDGVKVSGIRLGATVVSAVLSAVFMPMVVTKLCEVEKINAVVELIGSMAAVKSCVFFAMFAVLFAITCLACGIIKFVDMKKAVKARKVNSAIVRKVVGVNRQLEKEEKKEVKIENKRFYRKTIRVFSRILGGFVGALVGVVFVLVAATPIKFAANAFELTSIEAAFDETPIAMLCEKFDYMSLIVKGKVEKAPVEDEEDETDTDKNEEIPVEDEEEIIDIPEKTESIETEEEAEITYIEVEE